jgi:hypothetical protein
LADGWPLQKKVIMAHPIHPQTHTRTDFNIRLAQPEDRAALETIAAHIWEATTPDGVDQWYGDPMAVLRDTARLVEMPLPAPHRGGVVDGGCASIRPTRAGLARILHHFVMSGPAHRAAIRFSTADENVAVHALAQETA